MMTDTGRSAQPGNILLATDLGSRSDRALDRALQLARDWGATLHVVHVVPEETEFGIAAPDWSAPWHELDELLEGAERQLRRDLGRAAEESHTRVHVERGSPGEVICELARREGCGLIVTGVARNETLGRALLGDTVDFLVRKAPVPVLVVRNRAHEPYGEVLAASDFSPASAEALKTAIELFPSARTKLFHAYHIPFSGILAVNDEIRSEFRELGEKAASEFLLSANLPSDFPHQLELGSPAEAIARYLEDNFALIVIGSHGTSAVARVLLGSTARRILNHTTADVLVVPYSGRERAASEPNGSSSD